MRLIRTQGRGARDAAAVLAQLERRGGAALDAVLPAVQRIVRYVRRGGDRAMFRYAAKFDGLEDRARFRVTQEEMAEAWAGTDAGLRDALTTAARQIRSFAKRQMPKAWSAKAGSTKARVGLTVGQVVRAIESVGCYVPSGRNPLPSTLLMTAIPAQVAGV